MTSTTYLSQPHVQGFINWLANQLNCTKSFTHEYVNRRERTHWTFTSISNALSQYYWRHSAVRTAPAGTTLESNHIALDTLASELKQSVLENNDEQACLAAMDVMRWGGVTNGNNQWLINNKVGLAQTLRSVSSAINNGDWKHQALQADDLRFNAGMTKVYSLLADNFIIYDSRVAAALGWLVTQYGENQLTSTPSELAFPWAPAKEAINNPYAKNRNPSKGGFYFPTLRSGKHHAEWNLKASLILLSALEKSATNPFTEPGNVPPLRRLEASLFMLGYDLGGDYKAPTRTTTKTKPVAQGAPLASHSYRILQTRARKNPFEYRQTQDGLDVKGGPFFPISMVNDLLRELLHTFGEKGFPLSNSATKVRDGTAIPGLGTAYYKVTSNKGNPPYTSKLAVILEDIGALTYSEATDKWFLVMKYLDQHKLR